VPVGADLVAGGAKLAPARTEPVHDERCRQDHGGADSRSADGVGEVVIAQGDDRCGHGAGDQDGGERKA